MQHLADGLRSQLKPEEVAAALVHLDAPPAAPTPTITTPARQRPPLSVTIAPSPLAASGAVPLGPVPNKLASSSASGGLGGWEHGVPSPRASGIPSPRKVAGAWCVGA